MDHNDYLLMFRWIWKILTFWIWSRLWVIDLSQIAASMLGFPTWLESVVGLLAMAYVLWFWIRGAIRRWVVKDPSWTLVRVRRSRRGAKSGVDALAGAKPAKSVKSARPEGVVFGKVGRWWAVRSEGASQHVLIFGAPGTGKSQALALPTLSVWEGGLLAIDVKGELWEKVGCRQDGAMRFAVEDEGACGFDPFAEARDNPRKRHDVARTMALTLIPDNPEEKDHYWTEQSQNLLTAALLTGMEQGFSFVETMDVICLAGGVRLVDWIDECGCREAKVYNSSFIDMDEEKTLSSVYSTLHGKVSVFSVDEDVRACFSRERTVSPSDVRDGARVYLCLPESKLEQWKNITAMVVKLFLKDAETWEDGREQRTLFLVDEMPRLGKLPAVTNSLATLRSKGVCIVLICQSIAQLRVLYGRDETDAIVDLCAMKAILSASGETAELCSRLVGESVQRLRNSGQSSQSFEPLKASASAGTSEQWHAVMQAADFAHLGDSLVLIEPASGALKVRKMPWWKHKDAYQKTQKRP